MIIGRVARDSEKQPAQRCAVSEAQGREAGKPQERHWEAISANSAPGQLERGRSRRRNGVWCGTAAEDQDTQQDLRPVFFPDPGWRLWWSAGSAHSNTLTLQTTTCWRLARILRNTASGGTRQVGTPLRCGELHGSGKRSFSNSS